MTKFSRLLFSGPSIYGISLVVSMAVPSISLAQATFGAEFNFTNHTIAQAADSNYVNSTASETGRDRMMAQVRTSCSECRIVSETNHYGVTTYRVTYPDGWYFNIATDPAVVEIQTKPSTVEQLQKLQGRIQRDIFDTAQSVELQPASQIMGQSWAGSHMHVGLTSALGRGEGALKKLRNFAVDFSNHGELATGIFTQDTLNAPALFQLPEVEKARFRAIVADVDARRIRSANSFARRMRNEVYDFTPQATDPSTKYQALNLNRVGNKSFDLSSQTFELRSMRGQSSAEDFVILAELIDARLKYLESHGPVAIALPETLMSEKAKMAAFYRYVTETGLDFTLYAKFVRAYVARDFPNVIPETRALMCGEIFGGI